MPQLREWPGRRRTCLRARAIGPASRRQCAHLLRDATNRRRARPLAIMQAVEKRSAPLSLHALHVCRCGKSEYALDRAPDLAAETVEHRMRAVLIVITI